MAFKPSCNYAEAGLIAYGDDGNYFYVARKHHPGYGGPIFTVISEMNGVPKEEYIRDSVQEGSVYLKVTKEGSRYAGYYSLDQSNWIQIGSAIENKSISQLKIGLFANNAGGGSGYGDDADFYSFQLEGRSIPFGEKVPVQGLQAVLDAPEEVVSEEPFVTSLGYSHVTNPIQAQDIVIHYDMDRFEFIKAESKQESVKVVGINRDMPGQVRLIVASLGANQALASDGAFMELTWRAKADDMHAAGKIETAKVIVSDSEGTETNAAQAASTIRILPIVPGLPEDVNKDGKVSVGDLGIVAAHYGKNAGSPDWNAAKMADITKDGKIDIEDLAAVAREIL
ncbi:dockerin type I domain-containing protein [Paenibacillus sp. LHD-117]|uniref:beta-xylosidase family glycoside hydrolase n=1 Tax=Paenibacillus sp. LHD-117 TaxID=3071412 RepID=UPI0027E11E12|nr:dockerin type I domain-containing protein [Paenibacillus sp. LHD-117]MDQ6422955.1 dockerin type I domain-containing protein [Paenibacillus sp. LHD-117]